MRIRNIINKDEIKSLIKQNIKRSVSEYGVKWFNTTYLKHILRESPYTIVVDKESAMFADKLLQETLANFSADSIDILDDNIISLDKTRPYQLIRSKTHADVLIYAVSKVATYFKPVEYISEDWSKPNTVYHRVDISDMHEVADISDLFLSEWFQPLLSKLSRMSTQDVLSKMEEWHAVLNADADIKEDINSLTVLYTYDNGYKVIELKTKKQLTREGTLLKHCCAAYYDEVKRGNNRILSLRDPDNNPLVTIRINKNGYVVEMREFSNAMITVDKLELLKQFFIEQKLLVFINPRILYEEDEESDEESDEEDEDEESDEESDE